MQEDLLQKHLGEVKRRLSALEKEREILVTLATGYESLISLDKISEQQPQLQHPVIQEVPSKPKRAKSKGGRRSKGIMSMPGAVGKVLKDASGAKLHVSEIWRQSEMLGVVTTAKNPMSVVDWTCYSIPLAEKVGPRTWRWNVEKEAEQTNASGAALSKVA